MNIERAPTPKRMLPKKVNYLSMRGAYSVCRRGRHYFFRLFLLSRKVSNAMSRPPKEISKPIIPRKIIMISYAVICTTSLPMYSGKPVFIGREATTLSWVLFHDRIIAFFSTFDNMGFSGRKHASETVLMSQQCHRAEKKPGNPHKHWVFGLLPFIQTRLFLTDFV